MRILLAQLAPVPGDVGKNVERLARVLRAAPSDLAVFPELFLSGYRVGDRLHRLALRDGDPTVRSLREIAEGAHTTIVVGAPFASTERAGEVHNAAVAVTSTGELRIQVKRFLPTFGPFEEGVPFTPTDTSVPARLAGASVGLEVCYDAFFPEVSRDLALAGAELLVVLSAAPITSRPLFERLLPARAIENAVPVVYVNRVGVEDGVVFGGGSGAWDARGEPYVLNALSVAGAEPEETVLTLEVDVREAARWRPFRPVLRDVARRPGTSSVPSSLSEGGATPTRPL